MGNKIMRTIVEILSIESRTRTDPKENKVVTYWRTHALLDNQEEAVGYGKEFEIGDQVEAWWDDEWDQYKMQKGKK
jgi:hypothetical protein